MTRILVTGASSGIGRALALAYAKDGASLVLLGRDMGRLNEAAMACRAAGAVDVETHIADVRDRETMARLVSEADARAPIDILIANAGVATGLSQGQLTEPPAAVRAMMAINVNGVLNTVEPIIPAMSGRGAGQIAIVGSMAGCAPCPIRRPIAQPNRPSTCGRTVCADRLRHAAFMWRSSCRDLSKRR